MLNYIHRKESVVLTAIEIINELGIQGLSTREIARRQNISEGTLFKHFRSKNDMIIEVLNHFSQYDQDIMESIKMKGMSIEESIMYFIKSYAEYYENYPPITAIYNAYEILRWDEELCSKYKHIVNTRSEFLASLIKVGQESEEISLNIKCEELTDIILGYFLETTIKWRMSNYSFSLKDRVLFTLSNILKAFSVK